MTETNKDEDIDLQWELRVLCSDESCIGTIGHDGRCKECNRPYEGVLPEGFENPGRGEKTTVDDPFSPAGDAPEALPAQAEPADATPVDSADDEWERRTLCEDESCIGTIGPDGRCRECGSRYSGQI